MTPLVRIAPDLRAVFASHVAFEFVNRRCLRSPHDVERDGLVRVAAKTTDFKIAVPGIERVTQRRRRLRWSLVAEHAHVPRFAGELVGFLPRQLCFLGGKPDRMPVEIFAGLGAHRTRMRPADRKRQAATNCGGWRAGHNGGDAAPPVRCRCVSTGFGRSSSSKYPTAP